MASLGSLGIIGLMLSRRVLVRVLGLTLGGLMTAIAARAVDANSFARQVALSYHVDAQHVLAADIDRDGDLDVLAATEDGFKI
jgi:tRNA1(Val) A37 N6-methylase TrmN6